MTHYDIFGSSRKIFICSLTDITASKVPGDPSFRTSTWLSVRERNVIQLQTGRMWAILFLQTLLLHWNQLSVLICTRNLRANYQLLVTVSALWLGLDNIFQHMLIKEKQINLDEVYMRQSYLTYSGNWKGDWKQREIYVFKLIQIQFLKPI